MIGYYPNTFRHRLFYTQDKVGLRRNVGITDGQEETNSDVKETDFSQSIDITPRPRSNSIESEASSFHQSVQVVPGSFGKYEIYPGAHNAAQSKASTLDTKSLNISTNYKHNISNPDLWKQRNDLDADWQMRKESLFKTGKYRIVPKADHRKTKSEGNCNCSGYHSHTFRPPNLTKPTMKRESFTESVPKKSSEIRTGNANQLTIYNIFWCANLAFCDYKHERGMKPVNFQSLWPKDSVIKDLISCGVEDTGLRSAFWELCVLSILNGPLSVLKALLDLSYIRVDYQFENDPGLLHLACLLQNADAVQFLIQKGVSVKMKDKSGLTAGQVCYCSKVKKQLPTKLQSALERNKSSSTLKPGLQDKDAIFKLASNPKSFYELQKKLQMFEFSVNTESNEKGDFLIHTACRSGLCQLPLIFSLVRLQNANINMCSAEGLTPLMIAAADGDNVLCDTLICFFGADPNKQDERTGKTALHYSVMKNHVNVVNCLLKRGADVNIEDENGCLPDDIPTLNKETDDCQEEIVIHRKQRNQQLSEMVKEDTIYPIDLRETDLPIVDGEGYTLIMLAAKYDKVHNLETLLGRSTSTINAQHGKTGLTALGMAAGAGHHHVCRVLFRFQANPAIADMKGYLPLHHAVLGNHEEVLDVFRENFPTAYVGLYEALKLCRKSSIHDKLTAAWERRQEEIVNPELRVCAMAGNAERLFNILETGDNVNCKSDLNSQPALFIAVQNCHLEVVQLLRERGADLKKRDPQTGCTVLHVVAQTGHVEMAKYLLQCCNTSLTAGTTPKLDINAMNNEKRTALQIAADRGFIKMTSLLIEHRATTAILNTTGNLFTSPEYEGVRLQIETHRSAHTKQIMKLVSDRSKKALSVLGKIWLPRFDHNLRDKNGDTPLMVACRHGRLEVVKFLLQSAVYANHLPGDDEEENSDADSGVPDLPPWRSRKESLTLSEDIQASMEQTYEFGETLVLGASLDVTKSLNPGDKVNSLAAPHREVDARTQQVNALLQDVERPKGLYIYHDGIVSHVCAVNLFDGNTSLHRTIEGGDNPAIVTVLLEADSAVINMQNDAGLTAVHLACKLGRKKILEKLLTVPGVDIGLFTLNGFLPEEMTTSKTLINMIKKARKNQPVRPSRLPDPVPEDLCTSLTPSVSSQPSTIGSTIDYSRIVELYNRRQQHMASQRLENSVQNGLPQNSTTGSQTS